MDDSEARRLLGLDAGPLTSVELREARNAALNAHHPDRVGTDPAELRRANYWTTRINAAYAQLASGVDGEPSHSEAKAQRNGDAAAGHRSPVPNDTASADASVAGSPSVRASNAGRGATRAPSRVLVVGAVLLVAALGALILTRTDTPTAQASDVATPSLVASPTAPDGSALPRSAPELEALLPDAIDGTETVKFSIGGAEFMADQEGSGLDPAFVAFLERLGAQPDDISIAVALSINAEGGSAAIGAFRVLGASSDELEREFMATMEADDAVVEWQSASVGGKDVQTAPDPDTEGSTVYIYTAGDIVFFVTTPDDAVAAELLEPLP